MDLQSKLVNNYFARCWQRTILSYQSATSLTGVPIFTIPIAVDATVSVVPCKVITILRRVDSSVSSAVLASVNFMVNPVCCSNVNIMDQQSKVVNYYFNKKFLDFILCWCYLYINEIPQGGSVRLFKSTGYVIKKPILL